MNIQAEKTQENKSNAVANSFPVLESGKESSLQFYDNRPEASVQRKLQEAANNSIQVKQLRTVQAKADIFTSQNPRREAANGPIAPIQQKANNTGLPDNLQAGIENLSGHSMDDVKVHYNSNLPAQLQAHAFAQGTDIHIASGQEKHLPHEAWHVVQQKQGRVEPTIQMKSSVYINDDITLEKEADVMGAKAAAMQMKTRPDSLIAGNQLPGSPIQMMPGDSLIINKPVELLHTKSKNNIGKEGNLHLAAGDYGVELEGRNERWVKLKVLTTKLVDDIQVFGKMGWIDPEKASIEPGVVGPKDPIGGVPDKFAPLTIPLFTEDGPSSDDVGQGNLGTCWLLAPLASIADTEEGKNLIRGMITPNGNNTVFDVRFYLPSVPGESTETIITVSNLFPADSENNPEYAKITEGGGGLWPLVIEKAVAQLSGGYTESSGGDKARAFQLLTGNPAEVLNTADATDEGKKEYSGESILQKIHDALAADKPVSLGANKINHTEQLPFLRMGEEGDYSYMGRVSRTPATRIGLSVKYTNAEPKEITLHWGNTPKENLSYFEIEENYIVEIKIPEKDIGNNITCEVTYMTNDMNEEEYPELSAGHAYMAYSVDLEAQELEVVNPHDTSVTETIPAALLEKYKFNIVIGTVSPQPED